jgi:hypothetical protein
MEEEREGEMSIKDPSSPPLSSTSSTSTTITHSYIYSPTYTLPDSVSHSWLLFKALPPPCPSA